MPSVISEHQQWFSATTGELIVNGSVYIGVSGLDPTVLANQLVIYSDRALTTPIANPQTTDANGQTTNKIWISAVYYSLAVTNSAGETKYSELDNGSEGAGDIAYLPPGTGAIPTTVDQKLSESPSVFDKMTAAQIADVQAGTELLDVTAAVQAAWDASSCYMPEGTYMVDGLTASSNRVYSGAGDATIFKRLDSASQRYVIKCQTKNNVVFNDFAIDGNTANQSTDAHNLLFNLSSYNFQAINIKSTKAAGTGGSWGGGIVIDSSDDLANGTISKVLECVTDQNDTLGISISVGSNIHVIGNKCKSNGTGSGITVVDYTFPPVVDVHLNIVIDRNICLNNGGSGISAPGFFVDGSISDFDHGHGSDGTRGIIITNNTCRDNSIYGVAAQGTSMVITGNYCASNGTSNTGGILANCDRSVVSHNICESNVSYGIDAGASQDTTVSNNICYLNGTATAGTGINLGAAVGVTCDSNICKSNGGTAGGQQIRVSRKDGNGAGKVFDITGASIIISNNRVHCSDSDQIGISVIEIDGVTVSGNYCTGTTDSNSFVIASLNSNVFSNRANQVMGAVSVASAPTVVFPDWADTVAITGTTNITDLRTRSYNTYYQRVWKCDISAAGTGYTSAPTVSFTGGGGTGAAGTAQIDKEIITNIKMTNHGTGYTSAPTIGFTGGGGSAAAATAVVGCENMKGRTLTFWFQDVLTLSNGGSPNKRLAGAANFTTATNDMLVLHELFGELYETSRSIN